MNKPFNCLLGVLLGLSGLLSGCAPGQTGARAPGYRKMPESNRLSPPVADIFKRLGHPVATLEEANEFAQKNLLRDEKSERWHSQAATEVRGILRDRKPAFIKALRALGLLDEISPAGKSYDYALLMGAKLLSVNKRLDHLAELKRRGCRFGTVVLLGGERPLEADELERAAAGVKTEAQMMEAVYNAHPGFTGQRMLLVNAPMTRKADGGPARPTTDGTLEEFARRAPAGGTCLVISNNPYVVRQTLAARRILDQAGFPVDGAGAAISQAGADDIIMLMDEFARTLYEETKAVRQPALAPVLSTAAAFSR